MKITLHLDKHVHDNATVYFEKSKKAKKKIDGAIAALERTKKKLARLEKKGPEKTEMPVIRKKKKREWFEKFRWFYSSEGFLVVGGRDATTNEILIKKHTDADDLVFHTDMAGSPFFVVKADGKKVGDATIREAADATASFSRAWKMGLAASKVFYVKPDQVTKEAQAGEYLPKGAFMVRGRNNYVDNAVGLAIGVYDGRVMCAPPDSVRAHCKDHILVFQGESKPSDCAKLIKKKLKLSDTDEIIRALPSGGCKLE